MGRGSGADRERMGWKEQKMLRVVGFLHYGKRERWKKEESLRGKRATEEKKRPPGLRFAAHFIPMA